MATLDLLTPAEARVAIHLDADDTSLDEFLLPLASGVSGQIDEACGPVVIRTITDDRYDGGDCVVQLRETPAAAVTSVVERSGTAETEVASDLWDRETRGHLALLHRVAGGYDTTWTSGQRNVIVTYTAGRFAATEDVDPTWKAMATSILRIQYQQEAPTWAQRPGPLGEDEGFVPGYVSVEDMIRRRMPLELKPGGLG